jgi:4a-hydroxytetrahydrobiopterin dehydratase
MEDLHLKRCLACEAGVKPFNKEDVIQYLKKVKNWDVNADFTMISQRFTFKGFYKTMGFVNAIAWMAQQENHHPDLEVGYNYCVVKYTTHAIQGLSENDFICAAKVDELNPSL